MTDYNKLSEESSKYFKNKLGEFVYLRTYSKWIESENRRETWIETVDRYMNFMYQNLGNLLDFYEYEEIRTTILKQEVMPSMRLLQFAGKAADNTNVCAYNCSYIAPTCIQDFAEIVYILMCGTGVGFSVESRNIQALPQIELQGGTKGKYVVVDSKEGWADALAAGMNAWFAGRDVDFDYSKLRGTGARLKTFGGRSSGPDSLKALLDFTKFKILSKQEKRLSNLDVHDIICKIGEAVVSGGVRRSALISLSDLDDQALRDAKQGQFYYAEPQRGIANNSAVYDDKPTNEQFLEEWLALMKSGSGERGIFNRGNLSKNLPSRREVQGYLGTNPCGEIILRSKQFCNLTEVIARDSDTKEDILRKIRVATILGTYQSTLTSFKYLSKEWTINSREERLLGVSITGHWDSDVVRIPFLLERYKAYAIKINEEYAKQFNVNSSTCITCVKPSGTVSQTVDCASGMHPRYAPYYVRRVRISATDPLFSLLVSQGVPYHPEVGQTYPTAHTYVVEFPAKSPDGAICKNDLTAITQLEYWKTVKINYTEHNPSTTISIGPDEWIRVANWVYDNWDIIGGLSFLPRNDHVYQLTPYEEITKEEYEERVKKIEKVDFSKLVDFEKEDSTEVKNEFACVGTQCEL